MYDEYNQGLVTVKTEGLLQGSESTPYTDILQLHKRLALSIEMAKAAGKDPAIFIYPTLRANSFEELERLVTKLVPQSIPASEALVDALYTLTKQEDTDGKALQEQFKQKNIDIPEEISLSFLKEHLSETSAIAILSSAQESKTFLQEINAPIAVDQTFLLETLQEKIFLPNDTLKEIIALYDTNPYFRKTIAPRIPTSNSPEDFLNAALELHDIASPEGYAAWQKIMNSSSEMQQIFTDNLDLFISKEEQEYKRSLSPFLSEATRIQREQQFQQNSQLLRQLVFT